MLKKGDKVRRIQGCHEEMKVGDVAIVEGYDKYDDKFLRLCGYGTCHSADNFELVSPAKETTSKWLKENAWYIRVESPEHSKLIQEWLFEHRYYWEFAEGVEYEESPILTNMCYGGYIGEYILHGNKDSWCTTHAQELKPQFKLTLEGVTLPEAPKKTEQQLKLEELEATIHKAQQEIQQLKGMK